MGTPRPLAELQSDALRSPGDPVAALQLYFAQLSAGDREGAFQALHRIALRPDPPMYFFYLEALEAEGIGKWDAGWAAWEKYLAKTETDL